MGIDHEKRPTNSRADFRLTDVRKVVTKLLA